MALTRVSLACRSVVSQKFHFSTSCHLNNRWRKEQGLESQYNRFGPLTNLPDFSYVDGRPTPLSFRKLQKLERQKKFCQQIVELSHELDVALKVYNEREEQKKQNREQILKSKLKPKGLNLLKQQPKRINEGS